METIRFGYTFETVSRFCNGECGALAEAIERRTGWPIYLVYRSAYSPEHAVVQIPDGRFLDIQGLFMEDDLLEEWRAHKIEEMTTSFAEEDLFWHDEDDVVRAGRHAQFLLKRVERIAGASWQPQLSS